MSAAWSATTRARCWGRRRRAAPGVRGRRMRAVAGPYRLGLASASWPTAAMCVRPSHNGGLRVPGSVVRAPGARSGASAGAANRPAPERERRGCPAGLLRDGQDHPAPDGAEVSHDGAEVVFPRGGDSIQYLCWRAYLRFECRLLEKTIPRPAVLGLRSEDGDIYLPRTRIDVRVGLFRIHALSRDLGGRCTVTLLSGAPAAFREIDRVNGEMDFGGACPNCGEWIHPHWDPDADSG